MSDTGLLVRPLEEAERPWLSGWLERSWGSTTVVSRGTVHDASRPAGVVCESGDQRMGVLRDAA